MGLVVSDYNKLDDSILREVCKLKRKLLANCLLLFVNREKTGYVIMYAIFLSSPF
jgi:hypothetical protein